MHDDDRPDFDLLDDGTLDTVFRCKRCKREERFSYAALDPEEILSYDDFLIEVEIELQMTHDEKPLLPVSRVRGDLLGQASGAAGGKGAAGGNGGGVVSESNKGTWIDDRGYECGRCACGMEPSTHPDDAFGGLDFCPDCAAATCSDCRAPDGRCPECATATDDEDRAVTPEPRRKNGVGECDNV